MRAYKVAKHGNYGVSSGCGSSNVMEYLGYTFTNEQDKINDSMNRANICFLHAPLFSPGYENGSAHTPRVRRKNVFYMLGPLVNPAKPNNQLVGVYNLELARLYAYLYQKSAMKYTIVNALDGYDEVSLTCDFKTFSEDGEKINSIADLRFRQIGAK